MQNLYLDKLLAQLAYPLGLSLTLCLLALLLLAFGRRCSYCRAEYRLLGSWASQLDQLRAVSFDLLYNWGWTDCGFSALEAVERLNRR